MGWDDVDARRGEDLLLIDLWRRDLRIAADVEMRQPLDAAHPIPMLVRPGVATPPSLFDAAGECIGTVDHRVVLELRIGSRGELIEPIAPYPPGPAGRCCYTLTGRGRMEAAQMEWLLRNGESGATA